MRPTDNRTTDSADKSDANHTAAVGGLAPRRSLFDQQSVTLLRRFLSDWVWPRWRELAVAQAS